jgi:hypothetical protein
MSSVHPVLGPSASAVEDKLLMLGVFWAHEDWAGSGGVGEVMIAIVLLSVTT